MGEGFVKYKRKFRQRAFICSIVCGFSFGLFAFGTVYSGLKLAGIPLQTVYYALIAIVGALLCGGIVFLLLNPNDKKIAAELDNKYSLNEKVQTALAYKDANGEVIEILQSDTNERLLNLPKEKFNFKKAWKYLLIAIIAIAIFVTSLFVPTKVGADDSGGTLTPGGQFSFTESQMDDLQEIIDNVNKSPLSDDLKEATVTSLNKLMNNLMFAELNSEMIDYVNATVKSIDNIIKQPLSYKSVANALGKVGQNDLAKMIADGVQIYKEHVIVDYNNVEAFYEVRLLAVTEKIKDDLTEFFDSLVENEASDDVKAENDTIGIIEKTISDIYLALNLSTVEDEDALRVVLFGFAKKMAQDDNKLTNAAALDFDIKFNAELAEQTYRLAINKYIINNVCKIFGLDIPADENFTPTYSQNSNGGDKDDKEPQGGYGKGDLLYGSDDAVYDPITGEYVQYGEIYIYYYAIVEALLREGTLTEDQQAVIRAYFDILFNGIKAEE